MLLSLRFWLSSHTNKMDVILSLRLTSATVVNNAKDIQVKLPRVKCLSNGGSRQHELLHDVKAHGERVLNSIHIIVKSPRSASMENKHRRSLSFYFVGDRCVLQLEPELHACAANIDCGMTESQVKIIHKHRVVESV